MVSSPLKSLRKNSLLTANNATYDKSLDQTADAISPPTSQNNTELTPYLERMSLNHTYDKSINQDRKGINATYSFQNPSATFTESTSTPSRQVPASCDNPNATFNLPIQENSATNGTFLLSESNDDDTNDNASLNLRKLTYAIPISKSVANQSNRMSDTHDNLNLTYNNCDTSNTSEGQSNLPNESLPSSKQSSPPKVSRDSSQGKYNCRFVCMAFKSFLIYRQFNLTKDLLYLNFRSA